MNLSKNLFRTLTLSLALGGLTTSLKAGYYKPDFFPIGLTGINYTGDWNCPYYDKGPKWRWQASLEYPNSEDSLIYALGVNCIGCEDAWGLILLFMSMRGRGCLFDEAVGLLCLF